MNFLLCDKYFGDLDDFNKEFVAHKRTFWKDCQGLSFITLLNDFSFNVDFGTDGYRFGKRYFNNREKKFTWITTNNGYISDYVWDVGLHQRVQKSFKAIFTQEKLEDHFLGCFRPNRKAKFFYKLPKFQQDELKDYENALININKVDGKTYGGSQRKNSSILLVDIDNYDEDKAIDKLRRFLSLCNINVKDLLFIEQNVFTGGIHCAIKLPKNVEDNHKFEELEDFMKFMSCPIECNFINGILRFPLSYEYVALKHDERILDTEEFVSKDYWEDTFEHYLENLNWTPSNSNLLLNIFDPDTYLAIQKKEYEENKYKDYWKKKKAIIKRVDRDGPIVPKNKKFYTIIAGNRYKTMSKLIPYCKGLGYSLNEVVDIIYSVNESSKDLARWSPNQLYDNIRSFYNNCRVFDIKSTFNSDIYFSNKDKIPEITLKFLSDENVQNYLLNKFISNYIKERNKHNEFFDHLSSEKIDILKKILPIMFIEVIGKMFYDINNPKEFVKGINEELGFQLPDCLIKAIQNYSIKLSDIDSPIAKTSLQYLKKALIKTLNLQEISYKNRKRNWQLGSCKSFRIKSINDINNLLSHLYNAVYSNKVINEFLYNKNINIYTLILFILLQQNQGVEILTENSFVKIDDPPPN